MSTNQPMVIDIGPAHKGLVHILKGHAVFDECSNTMLTQTGNQSSLQDTDGKPQALVEGIATIPSGDAT